MKRRQFIGITLPATGAILAAPGLMDFQIRKEIMPQFTGESAVDEYDVIINGAGLAGYFAAIEAANQGKSVLIVDNAINHIQDNYMNYTFSGNLEQRKECTFLLTPIYFDSQLCI